MKTNAYITGSSTGIGACFAEKLAADYNLIIIARNESKLNELAETIKQQQDTSIEILPCDLTKQKDIKVLNDKIAADGNIGLLVNNAGFGTYGEFSKLSLTKELSEIQLNIITLVRLTHTAIKNYKQRTYHGGIINVASVAAFLPTPSSATYGATKAYVKSFTEAIHEEVKPYGINIQALCPGLTRTEFQDRAGIETEKMPAFLWMESAQVVDESLKAFAKQQAVCIPGLMNQSTAAILDLIPSEFTRKISNFLMEQNKN